MEIGFNLIVTVGMIYRIYNYKKIFNDKMWSMIVFKEIELSVDRFFIYYLFIMVSMILCFNFTSILSISLGLLALITFVKINIIPPVD